MITRKRLVDAFSLELFFAFLALGSTLIAISVACSGVC